MKATKLLCSRNLLKVFGTVIPPPSQKGNGIICQYQVNSQREMKHPMQKRKSNG